jgi:hypothetical protein
MMKKIEKIEEIIINYNNKNKKLLKKRISEKKIKDHDH